MVATREAGTRKHKCVCVYLNVNVKINMIMSRSRNTNIIMNVHINSNSKINANIHTILVFSGTTPRDDVRQFTQAKARRGLFSARWPCRPSRARRRGQRLSSNAFERGAPRLRTLTASPSTADCVDCGAAPGVWLLCVCVCLRMLYSYSYACT